MAGSLWLTDSNWEVSSLSSGGYGSRPEHAADESRDSPGPCPLVTATDSLLLGLILMKPYEHVPPVLYNRLRASLNNVFC